MHSAAAPFTPTDAAPESVRRFGLILARLAATVAWRFLREPALVALIVPLWNWLNRAVRRLERAMTGPAVARAAVAKQARGPRAQGVRLPGGRGWLVRVLGHEAAASASQLQHLLNDPEMQAMLVALPAVGRVLRPVCRMLGVTEVAGLAAPAVAPKPRRVRTRRTPVWEPGRAALRAGDLTWRQVEEKPG